MVRELFEMARTKKACLIFFDEIDAVGGARFDDGAGGDNEVQRTMLELINQLDGFDPRGNIKVRLCLRVASSFLTSYRFRTIAASQTQIGGIYEASDCRYGYARANVLCRRGPSFSATGSSLNTTLSL